jgi:hypothetical protein
MSEKVALAGLVTVRTFIPISTQSHAGTASNATADTTINETRSQRGLAWR